MAHQYWRAVALEAYGAGDLELSSFHLLDAAGVRLDAPATLTASAFPVAGAVEALRDTDLSTFARWPAQSLAALALTWDFGAPVDVADIRLSGDSNARFLLSMGLQCSSDGMAWTDALVFAGIAWPGAASLSTSSVRVVAIKGFSAPSVGTLSEADRVVLFTGGSGWNHAFVDRAITMGQAIYFEVEIVADGLLMLGIAEQGEGFGGNGGDGTKRQYFFNGQKRQFSAYSSYGPAYTVGDVIGFAVERRATSTVLTAYKNGVSLGEMYTIASAAPLVPFMSGYASGGSVRFSTAVPASRVPVGFERLVDQLPPPTAQITTNAVAGRASARTPVTLTIPSGAVKDYATGVLGQGIGRIQGTVKEKHTPENTPLKCKVWLIRERDGLKVREVESDALTGAYSFDYIDELQVYTVLSYHPTGEFRATVANGLIPEIM